MFTCWVEDDYGNRSVEHESEAVTVDSFFKTIYEHFSGSRRSVWLLAHRSRYQAWTCRRRQSVSVMLWRRDLLISYRAPAGCFCLQHVQLSGLRSQLGIRSQTSFVFTEFFRQSASLCLSHSLGYSELQFLASILRVCGPVLHSAPTFFRSNKIDVKRVRYMCALHACAACVRYMCALHVCAACVHCMRALHACAACVLIVF